MIVSFQVFYWTCNRTKDCSMISRPHCYVDILTFSYTCTTWTMNRRYSNNNSNNTTTVTRSYDFIMAMLSIESVSISFSLSHSVLISSHFPLFLSVLRSLSRDDVAGYEKEFNKNHIFYLVFFSSSRFLSIVLFFFVIVDRSVHWNSIQKWSVVKMVARFGSENNVHRLLLLLHSVHTIE